MIRTAGNLSTRSVLQGSQSTSSMACQQRVCTGVSSLPPACDQTVLSQIQSLKKKGERKKKRNFFDGSVSAMRKGLTTKKPELKIKQNIPISCYCHGHPKKKQRNIRRHIEVWPRGEEGGRKKKWGKVGSDRHTLA